MGKNEKLQTITVKVQLRTRVQVSQEMEDRILEEKYFIKIKCKKRIEKDKDMLAYNKNKDSRIQKAKVRLL